MSNEILKTIKRKIQERVARKELYSIFTNSKEIELITNCVSGMKNSELSPEESKSIERYL